MQLLRMAGSNVYEVNPWLWQFGCFNPRLGGLAIEETSESEPERQDVDRKASDKRGRRLVRVAKASVPDQNEL